MNKDIPVMEELQRYNDALFRGRKEISTAENEIKELTALQIKENQEVVVLENSLKNEKVSVASKERDLTELETEVVHINERLAEAQNEKEVKAGLAELQIAEEKKESIEMAALLQMDEITEATTHFKARSQEVRDSGFERKKRVDELNERIARFKKISEENEAKFNEKSVELQPPVRSRFIKLSQAKGGKALVALLNGACSSCYNTVPPDDLSRVGNGELLVCTNCGKYLYNG